MKKILPILGFLFLYSCEKKISNKNYDKYISYFEGIKEGVTSHFPTEIKFGNEYIYQIDTTAYFNTQEFNLQIIGVREEIEYLKKLYHQKKVYNIGDECIIVVNDFIKSDDIPFIPSEEELLYEDKDKVYMTTFSDNCKENKYKVIPNFWSDTYGADKNSKNNLNNKFKYIILDMDIGKGVYSPKLNSNISYMPDFAKHGYSKGIAFNEKENIIIYWVIFW